MTEGGEAQAPKPVEADAAKARAAAQAKTEVPSRVLPSDEDLARFAAGEDVETVGTLFEGLKVARFDAFVMQIRKQELLAQHWQVISKVEPPPDEEFDRLAEVGRLRVAYRDQELSRRRLEALRVAWRELRGKRPSLWQVPDLFAALRRILEKDIEVDFNELLHATRDIWLGMSQPVGRDQVEILWACLAVIRKGTKK